jgi:hypothetical protein
VYVITLYGNFVLTASTGEGKSPLSEALRKNNKEAVKLLLKFNADPNRALCDCAKSSDVVRISRYSMVVTV